MSYFVLDDISNSSAVNGSLSNAKQYLMPEKADPYSTSSELV